VGKALPSSFSGYESGSNTQVATVPELRRQYRDWCESEGYDVPKVVQDLLEKEVENGTSSSSSRSSAGITTLEKPPSK